LGSKKKRLNGKNARGQAREKNELKEATSNEPPRMGKNLGNHKDSRKARTSRREIKGGGRKQTNAAVYDAASVNHAP